MPAAGQAGVHKRMDMDGKMKTQEEFKALYGGDLDAYGNPNFEREWNQAKAENDALLALSAAAAGTQYGAAQFATPRELPWRKLNQDVPAGLTSQRAAKVLLDSEFDSHWQKKNGNWDVEVSLWSHPPGLPTDGGLPACGLRTSTTKGNKGVLGVQEWREYQRYVFTQSEEGQLLLWQRSGAFTTPPPLLLGAHFVIDCAYRFRFLDGIAVGWDSHSGMTGWWAPGPAFLSRPLRKKIESGIKNDFDEQTPKFKDFVLAAVGSPEGGAAAAAELDGAFETAMSQGETRMSPGRAGEGAAAAAAQEEPAKSP